MRHIFAIITAFVWGTTFVASKLLLNSGMSPVAIMSCRFAIGYICIWIIYPKTVPFRFNKDELLFFFLGLTGGSLYFLLEYTALHATTAINVGLISSTVPIFAAIIAAMIGWIRIDKTLIIGSLTAFAGVTLVILNGDFSFTIYPFGDILAILSAICWAVYTLILRKIGTKYSEFLISRRLFLYGMITIFPLFIYTFPESGIENITQREFFIPILYLGIIASGVCIWLWNKSITEIGLISTNNYLYLLPVISVVTSNILLHEEISKYIIIGTLLILIGIYCVRTKDYKKYESINY